MENFIFDLKICIFFGNLVQQKGDMLNSGGFRDILSVSCMFSRLFGSSDLKGPAAILFMSRDARNDRVAKFFRQHRGGTRRKYCGRGSAEIC